MRLFYVGFSGLAIFGACVVAHNLRTGEKRSLDMVMGGGMFVLGVFLLGALSVVLSQRLLAVQAILGAFFGASMLLGRPVGLKYAPIAVIALFMIWVMREAATVGQWDKDISPIQLGFERIIFYFVNNFGNATWVFGEDIKHTLGFFSFRFFIYFAQLDSTIPETMFTTLQHLNRLRGGGEFPTFTAPYVDFSYFGIIVIVLIAALFTFIYNRAQASFVYSYIYGMIAPVILLSTHAPLHSSHNFVFNIIVALIVCAFIRRPVRSGQTPQAAAMARPNLVVTADKSPS
jgi:hypothetical protein